MDSAVRGSKPVELDEVVPDTNWWRIADWRIFGDRKKLLAIDKLFQAAMVPHREIVTFVERRLHGRGVGWIDIHLLASAIVDGLNCGRPIPVCQWSLPNLALPTNRDNAASSLRATPESFNRRASFIRNKSLCAASS